MKDLMPWGDLLRLPSKITRPIGLITLSLILIFALGFFLREPAKDNPIVFFALFLACVLTLVLAGIAMLNAAERRSDEDARAHEEAKIALSQSEFVLVVFSGIEQRTVLANDVPVGVTNHVLLLPRQGYAFSLEGGHHVPPEVLVDLVGTSLIRPYVIFFAPAKEEDEKKLLTAGVKKRLTEVEDLKKRLASLHNPSRG